jgi:hypothetical protein
MQLIAHQELTSAAASITFSSIPATFTDLYLVVSARTDVSSVFGYAKIKFNGSSSSYSIRGLQGDGSSAYSFNNSIFFWNLAGASATASTFGNASFYIPNYTSAANKSISHDGVFENNATGAHATIQAGLWSVTDPITSISLSSSNSGLADAGNFVSGSSATLYGITAGSSGGVTVS